jgi:hypothetical protein
VLHGRASVDASDLAMVRWIVRSSTPQLRVPKILTTSFPEILATCR